jgi:hypothetical protein
MARHPESDCPNSGRSLWIFEDGELPWLEAEIEEYGPSPVMAAVDYADLEVKVAAWLVNIGAMPEALKKELEPYRLNPLDEFKTMEKHPDPVVTEDEWDRWSRDIIARVFGVPKEHWDK